LSDLVVVLLAWATGLTRQQSRTQRFVVIAGALTVAWVVVFLAAAPVAFRATILGVLVLVAIVPEVFGIRAVSRREAKADELYERIDSETIGDTVRRLEYLEQVRNLVPDDAGRIVATRLKLWVATRRQDPSVLGSTVPVRYFERAAIRFFRDAQWRHVLGWRDSVTAWEEDIALRGFHEEAKTLLPSELRAEKTPIEVAPWVGSVETLLRDLSRAPLRDAAAQDARDKLHAAISALLAVSLGDRSENAVLNQEDTAQAMRAAWKSMAEHIETIRPKN
jgi:hypothetical protein